MFGHLRSYKLCYPQLKKHLLDLADFDIFIHTWDELERKTKSHSTTSIKSLDLDENKKKEIKTLYKPKKIVFDQQIQFYPPEKVDKHHGFSMNGIRNMHYSMAQSCKLRNEYEANNKVKYDLVIVIRPDIYLREDFPIKNIISRLNKTHLQKSIFSAPYLNQNILLKKAHILDNVSAAYDVFFMGTQESIDIISTISDSDDFYASNDAERWGEPQFANFLIKNQLNQKFITYIAPKCWHIQRTHNISDCEQDDFKVEMKLARKYFKSAIKKKVKKVFQKEKI